MVQTNNGVLRYIKDKRFIAKANIPQDILDRLELGKDTPDIAESLNPAARICLFCGMGSKIPRLIHGKTVYLCEMHYHEKNMGQIAQRVRELSATN